MSEYEICAHAYLARAKNLIQTKTKDALFYSAFELRACIEARQSQYLDAQASYARSLPRDWEIGKQRRQLQRIFKGTSIQQLVVDIGNTSRIIRYIPVSENLSKAAENLGDILHAAQKYRAADDEWWERQATWISSIAAHAEFCCTGTLLCPALLNKGEPTGNLAIELRGDLIDLPQMMTPRAKIRVSVDYISNWLNDLPSLRR